MDVYEIVTQKILDQLAKGVIPWRKPWTGSNGAPMNWVSKKEYRGINRFLLEPGEYVTFKQAKATGGTVKKGEKGSAVIFWKLIENRENDAIKKFPLLRYYTVFEIAQCDGIERRRAVNKPGPEFNPIESGESILHGFKDKPRIIHSGSSAYYTPNMDEIHIPEQNQFENPSAYYSTLFHECIHSTGHKSRLQREDILEKNGFGTDEYAFEELVAEFGSAMLCSVAEIDQDIIPNAAAYIAAWSKKIKQEKRWLIQAASQAQKAADWVLGLNEKNCVTLS